MAWKTVAIAIAGAASIAAASASAQDRYVFGATDQETAPRATLTFDAVTPYVAVDTGWISSTGSHVAGNPNYLTGTFSTSQYNSYFSFAIAAANAASPYGSAVLTIRPGISGGTLPDVLTLFDVGATVAQLTQGRNPGDAAGMALYTDLGSGVSYGSYTFGSATVLGGPAIQIKLNQAFLDRVNAGLLTNFSIGGTLAPGAAAVPEPATWGMMVLGFAAVGGFLRRRVRQSEARFDARLRAIVDGAEA